MEHTRATLEAEAGFVLVETLALSFARYVLLGDDTAAVAGVVQGVELPAGVSYQSHWVQ